MAKMDLTRSLAESINACGRTHSALPNAHFARFLPFDIGLTNGIAVCQLK